MSEEYIHKEKVLSELCSDCKGIAYCRVPCALYNYINNSSPVDAKPVVRGEWIPDKHDPEFKLWCSACNWTGVYPYNFCPNCGADMRKEKDDER